MITLTHLHKYFNKGKSNEIHVIDDVSLTLPEHGIVAIFGRSGCGKTTLLNVIGGLDSYHSGSLTENGRAITSNPDCYRNRDIGYIFQNYNLLKEESCFDNVANALRLCGMTDKGEIASRVETALSFVDMAEYKGRTPDTLSGGQQQRVAIARAIVKNPRIILADEPTGNLDEANTVMVMDLLREIARDCLVLLVTHEADLVDYYCDTVIELDNGRVVDIRENHVTDGYQVRDKNTIYLGEFEKESLENEAVSVSYYGNKPTAPISIKLVSYGGKTYLSVESPDVKVLGADSEMKLYDGVFERHEEKAKKESHVDMSRLPRVEGSRFGRLFTAKRAIVSGYISNFSGKKKGKNVLRRCLALFAAVIVFATAIFGTSIGRISEIASEYNHNVFYVRANENVSMLNDPALREKYGIDTAYVLRGVFSDTYLFFTPGYFETFDATYYGNDFSTHGVFLPSRLSDSLDLLAGKREVAAGEIVLSSASADLLLESLSLGYLKTYEDLLGLSSEYGGIIRGNLKIVGIVESEETAFYMDEAVLARASVEDRLNVASASEVGITVEKGTAVYYSEFLPSEENRPGKTVMIAGKAYTVTKTVVRGSYDEYLAANGIKKEPIDSYMNKRFAEEYPELQDKDEGYFETYEAFREREEVRWHLDYYSEIEDYCRLYYFFQPSFEAWLYLEKGIPVMFYQQQSDILYRIASYEKEFGKMPTMSEVNAFYPTYDKDYYVLYGGEYETTDRVWRSTEFVVNDEDYLTIASSMGESDRLVDPFDENDKSDYYNAFYTVLHASDPERASAFLAGQFPEEDGEMPILITPEAKFEEAFHEERIVILTGILTMAIILAVMSVCMYFIMRSSLMNRIREVGILRAIGVSKRNLVFRFAVETAVLTVLTVFVGYLLSSGFIALSLSASGMVSDIFFYPLPIALSVLVLLFGICMICGLIPIVSLLRKTPSAILAKYDI